MWRCGGQSGFEQDRSGSLFLPGNGEKGLFVSMTYDSGERQTQWSRIVLRIGRKAMISVYVWLFDEKSEGDEADAIEDIGERFLYVQKRSCYHSHYRGMLLFGGQSSQGSRGRYAKFAVEMLAKDGEEHVNFTGYSLSFPKESFADYLPSIYRDDLSLERFLAVHQGIYLEQEEWIGSLPRQLDYEYCNDNGIARLAGMMGWDELLSLTSKAGQRQLLREGVRLAGRKGTRQYYVRLAEILLHPKVQLWEDREGRRVTVYVPGAPRKGWRDIADWFERNAPIGVRMDFVFERGADKSELGGNYILDETSYLSDRESGLSGGGVCVDNMELL
ncbi:MAG: hypothetical protein NC091_07980 [Bacteroides sp.]|nr:hypothetical protein [Bacteroides sp.]